MNYFLLPILTFLLPEFAFAQNYTLMAPMGSILSGSPDLTTYLQGAVIVVIGIAGLLAVSMTVFCSMRLMMAQSASARSAAKECIWNAIYGLLLAIGAWIILYTINPFLLSSEVELGNVALAPLQNVSATIPQGTYQWSSGTTCTPVAGKIVSVMPPSYCSGTSPSTSGACCGYADSPFRPRTGTPTGTTGGETAPSTDPTTTLPETPITFAASTFTVNEDEGPPRMTVSRNSGDGSVSVVGVDTVTVRSCDRRQCTSRQISLVVEEPCVTNQFMTCKVLPTGSDPALPMCIPPSGLAGINGGLVTHAYKFRIVSDDGGGVIRLVGGDQKEFPPLACLNKGSCFNDNDNDDRILVCTGDSESGRECTLESGSGGGDDCEDNTIPSNIVASISSYPGDLSSTASTAYSSNRRISGYCGNGGSLGTGQISFTISTNKSGVDICTVEKERTYYLNVTTIPDFGGGDPLYSLFRDFVP
ncbi:MAG: hypothetical protein A3D65_04100 [Candidatus Lloydbacteria bacterium RIFCSPHIGHO2_02_FULL_50_13]|uniref:Uncharacterized protein n=1 Tax=Candidatus Lloydbacteria bacterium RIFCSPHIGHO2_02_FULL_50_13 TaxID=1798661 RepID=A0A1G2D539_9BACT|nr:MAG: hypothetical protein A3D65_04100 [Candidatus Lloydbacteria bacterium RIFCSPHIGHO2_02_FULL_50_13]